ncbi:hypothetical protein AMAG_12331 [Allomyces macrogynus ATCC 38327]|uniref:F-box domain-containing protein n=1 Tax=Allomyces macrogynus (strain ATCC 38327) TaxID=578462 RepID=A0A0L0SXM7_ALLM3|nr:hypothetical protein AMAG_12331 [Allomyces macrogynus ATCC 38327]|eukprot:KNE67262.1 hypothetical protein AMAG_12331 [Allomyces macrogynus ATCC 38327]
MQVDYLESRMLDHALPPHLVTLALKRIDLDTTRAKLLAAHLPKTLRHLALNEVEVGQHDIGPLVLAIPPGVRDLAIVNVQIGDDLIRELARVILPNLTHLRLVSTGVTQRGLMAVIVVLPAGQLVSLTLGGIPLHMETATALAAWLARTTQLKCLGLHHMCTKVAPNAIDFVLAALPSSLRSLELPGSLYSATSLATHMSRVYDLEVLDVSNLLGPPGSLADLIPTIRYTLKVLRMAYIDMYETDLAEMLYRVGRPWCFLVEVDLRCAQLGLQGIENVFYALERILSCGPGPHQEPRPHVLLLGNLVTVRQRRFRQIREWWATNGWDIEPCRG